MAVISVYDMTKSITIEKMQSDFVANASHELRTPLSVISGFIETLRGPAKDDAQAQENFLKIMADQAEYMSSLIENLLSLSKIEMKQDQKPEDNVDILDLTEDVAQALSLKAQERGMQIKVVTEDDIPNIVADHAQIKQILQNMLDNAIEASLREAESARHLELLISKKQGYETICVKNRISKSVLEENPGLLSTKEEKGEAHGIGILRIKEIAESCHGMYDVYEMDGFFCVAVFIPE